ncbi:MAG: SUMF1/EgtB/PvdO family nonheme iron enzyme [Planctomycetota bacterium]|nr:SUMF1/EgtB/PvdO family nonheme iron enzyme [Planctomycetota bacterium]
MISVRGVARAVVAAAVCVFLVSAAEAVVNIQTIPVGNPGNTADIHGAGSGAVAYTYNIGKFEVTAGQYTGFLTAVAKTDTYGLYNTEMSRTDNGSGITRSGSSGSYAYSVDPAFVNRPVNYVSWGDSARFANWLHNGQPTTGGQGLSTTEDGAYYLNGATSSAQLIAVSREADWKWAITSADEWYKAAYHKNDGVTGNYWDYPTGSNTAPGRDMADASGNNANYFWDWYIGIYPIDSGKYTTVAGEFQNSDSPYGTFDQGGNVWEWNEAILYGSDRGQRGGSFGHNVKYLHTTNQYISSPTIEASTYGFRVSEVPEPATMSLLALGGLALVARRRGRK